MRSNLYILTLIATRFEDATFTAGASTLLTVKDSETLAQSEGMQHALEKFPPDEGWVEHQVSIFEVPAQFETDHHTVAWTVSTLGDEPA
jgi:hypothetical protein